jgi:putative membrane protein
MVTATAALAQSRGGYDDHMGWDDGGTWVMLTLMILVAIAIVGGIIWAIVFAARSANQTGPGTAPTSGPNARDVLDQRYARGEIDTADYEERRSKLG